MSDEERIADIRSAWAQRNGLTCSGWIDGRFFYGEHARRKHRAWLRRLPTLGWRGVARP